MVQFLVKHGANVNARDQNGSTPLHLLVEMINRTNDIKEGIEIAEFLVKNGADFNAQNQEGKTLLHEIAEDSDWNDLAKVLVEYVILENPAVEKPNYLKANEEISEYWDEFLGEVRNEISRMRAKRIDGAITFYDILTSKDSNELASYMQNKNITTELKAENYKSEFPLFANKIQSQHEIGTKRADLLKKGEESITRLVDTGCNKQLPQASGVSRKMVEYPINDDIENLSKAADGLTNRKGTKREASFEEGESSTKYLAISKAEECSSSLNNIKTESLCQARSMNN